MTHFRITFHGAGYDILPFNGQEVGGFYVVVLVTASSAADACSVAIDKLQRTDEFQIMTSRGQGVLSISECQVDPPRDPRELEISGYVLYPRDSAEMAEK